MIRWVKRENATSELFPGVRIQDIAEDRQLHFDWYTDAFIRVEQSVSSDFRAECMLKDHFWIVNPDTNRILGSPEDLGLILSIGREKPQMIAASLRSLDVQMEVGSYVC